MSTTATMTKQSSAAPSRQEVNPVLFMLKKVITAIHFALLMGIFLSVILAPKKCQYFIIAAAVTLLVAVILPPRGMLKPDDAAPHWLEKNEAAKGKKE